MHKAGEPGFRILVVGDVISERNRAESANPPATENCATTELQQNRIGGAANVARVVAEFGVSVGFLCVNEPENRLLCDHLTQFDALLPQYAVIVLSDYPQSGLSNLNHVIASAKALGKQILIDPQVVDFSHYAGASVLTPTIAILRHVIGAWNDEVELAAKVRKLLVDLDVGALVLNRYKHGVSLYTALQVTHFQQMVPHADYSLIAALAVNLTAGRSISAALAIASRDVSRKTESVDKAGLALQWMTF